MPFSSYEIPAVNLQIVVSMKSIYTVDNNANWIFSFLKKGFLVNFHTLVSQPFFVTRPRDLKNVLYVNQPGYQKTMAMNKQLILTCFWKR